MRNILVTLLFLLACGQVSAQREFTLEVRGGLLSGGLRDDMYSPLNYKKTGFTTGLEGAYRFGKSQIGLNIGYNQGTARTTASDYFTSDYLGIHIGVSYLHNVWQPSAKIGLWCGGGYSFGIDGLVWERQDYTYAANHTFAPIVKLDWKIADRHNVSTQLSAYLFGFISRPPYNFSPEHNEIRRSSLYYLMCQLGHAEFAAVGRYWNVDWNAQYHYRISRSFMLGFRYGFRFQRYRETQQFSQYDNTFALSVKITL